MDSARDSYRNIFNNSQVSTAFYSRQTYRFIISIRGSLLATIYAQTLKRRSGEMGTDTAITLMGTDVERISTSLRDIHEIWASPIDIGLALWLLERQLAVSCLMPVILSLGMYFQFVIMMVLCLILQQHVYQ